VASVRGVAVVDNQLEAHDEPGDVPGLQGQPRRSPAMAQFDWSPGARLAAFSVGSLLMARCARHPTPLNVFLGTAGFGLFVRAATTVGRTRPAPKTQPAPAEPAVSAR
jgi:hypothetical protein